MRRASFVLSAALFACSRAPEQREAMGTLPTALTTAEPLWIPFRIRAGKNVELDARETHFAELRRVTFDGHAGVPVWDPSGMMIHAASALDCRATNGIDLTTGAVTRTESKLATNSLAFAGTRIASYCEAAKTAVAPPCDGAGLFGTTPWRSAALPIDSLGCELSGEGVLPRAGYDLVASADGRRIAFASRAESDGEIFTAAANGSNVTRITSLKGHDLAPRFSPNGALITWAARRALGKKDGDDWHVWIASASGSRPRQVTFDGRGNGQPAFFPDSRQLIFASDRDSTAAAPRLALYRTDPEGPVVASGGTRIERITFAEGDDAAPVFSPDGRWLAFLSSRAGAGMDLYLARWRED